MKRKKRRRETVLVVLLLVVAAAVLSLDVYDHQDDWLRQKGAVGIAVKDAGTSEALIYDLKTVFGTTQDGLPVYEVLFSDYTAQYRYVIDAQSGQVLEKSKTLS